MLQNDPKRLEVLKIELDKMAIKLNDMKLDIGMIMQKIILKNLQLMAFLFD